jgi:hypothetical protein
MAIGKSLKINLGGKKAWSDFASGDSGDLLDLWVLVRNCQCMTPCGRLKNSWA